MEYNTYKSPREQTSKINMNLLKQHKTIDKNKEKELQKLNEETNDKFIRFQLDNNVRPVIANAYNDDIIVNLVMQMAQLVWRPMENQERTQIQEELAKKAGIVLPK